MQPAIEHELSNHFAALRRLARDLVGDGDADDLVQEAALAVLRRPPPRPGPLAGWLQRIVRRLANRHRLAQRRRQRREREVARAEALPPPQQLSELREQLQRVTAAVLGLPEPYQHTLLLRYLQELPPPAIAARDGVPLATVKSRLQRALAMLRAQFDAGGRGGDWRAALAGVFGLGRVGTGAAITSTGVMAMGTGMKVMLGAAAVLVAAAATWVCVGPAPTAPPAATGANGGALGAIANADAASGDAANAAAAVQRIETAVAAPTSDVPTLTIRGRCLAAEDSTPLAGCRIEAGHLSEPEQAVRTVSGSDGAFAFAVTPQADRQLRLEVHAEHRVTRVTSATDLPLSGMRDLGDVLLQRGGRVLGILVDEAGSAVPKATVIIVAAGTDLLSGRHYDLLEQTDTEGGFTFAAVPPGNWQLDVIARDLALSGPTVLTVPPTCADTSLRLVLARPPSLRGVVVDEAGQPIAKASVGWWPAHSGFGAAAETAADGTFEVFARTLQPEPGMLDVRCNDAFEPWRADTAVAWGTHDLRIVLHRALQLRVRVVESVSRKPVARFAVLAVPARGGRGDPRLDYAPADAEDGCRTLTGFRHGPHRIAAFADDRALLASPWTDVDAEQVHGTFELTVERLQPQPVRVTDTDGAAMAGIQVELLQLGNTRFQQSMFACDPWSYRENYVEQAPAGVVEPLIVSKTETGAHGEALLFTRTAPTQYGLALRATGPGIDPWILRSPALVAGQPFPIIVQRAAKLSGRVQVKGYRLARPSVVAEYCPDRSSVGGGETVQVALDGTFTFASLRSGDYRIWFATAGRGKHAPALAEITLRPGEARRLDLDASRFDAAQLRGRIVVDGTPLPAARVVAQFHGWWNVCGPFQAGADGAFAADDLVPGPYTFGFETESNGEKVTVLQPEPLQLAPGDAVTRDLHFTRRRLRVCLRDAAGAPLAGREVRLGDREPQKRRTDGHGIAAFDWVAAGETTVAVEPGVQQKVVLAPTDVDRQIELVAR